MLTFDLIKNYFLVATRNLKRNKFYSLISIFSISIGIIISILALQYVFFENNYDNYHEESELLFRINSSIYTPNGELTREQAINFPGLSPVLREMSDVEASVYFMGPALRSLRIEDQVYQQPNIIFTENSSVFDIFNFEIVSGNVNDLDQPGTLFISETMAETYFGEENPLGKTIEFSNPRSLWDSFEVKGIYKDVPAHSHIAPSSILHGGNLIRDMLNSGAFGPISYDDLIWRLFNSYTYVRLNKNVSLQQFQTQLDQTAETYRAAFDENGGIKTKFSVQPVTDIHTTLGIQASPGDIVDPSDLRFIFLIGLVSLLIGWVNYVNIATARSLERAKEIGIRKYVGSSKGQLIIQFLLESMILNTVALLISIIVVASIIPFYHNLVGQDIFNYALNFLDSWLLYFGILLLGMILSGFYPAFVLSNFKSVKVLRGSYKNNFEGVFTRKGLVVSQFAISIFLILAVLTVFKQVNYLKNLDTGIDLEQTYYFNAPSGLQNNESDRYETFIQELESNSNISKVTNSTSLPGWINMPGFNGSRIDPEKETESININLIRAKDNYFDHYGIQLVAGRYLDRSRQMDLRRAILNETGVYSLGFNSPEEAIGQLVVRTTGDSVEVVGVVEDFAQRTMQYEQVPIMFQLPIERGFLAGFGVTSLKINPENIAETTLLIETTFEKHFPGSFFNGVFLEDEYWNQYGEQDLFATILSSFTLFSVLISILGLIGLSTFMINQRAKEISIRKILGSSGNQIIYLIYKDYFKLIAIASIFAVPAGIFWVRDWLNGFPIRIDADIITIGITLIIVTVIISLAISHQTIRAIRTNPVNNLRKS